MTGRSPVGECLTIRGIFDHFPVPGYICTGEVYLVDCKFSIWKARKFSEILKTPKVSEKFSHFFLDFLKGIHFAPHKKGWSLPRDCDLHR